MNNDAREKKKINLALHGRNVTTNYGSDLSAS